MATPEKAINNRFPKITEEGLNDRRKRIGVKIADTLEPWSYEATRDANRHYAHGIGDNNPLSTDPAYAEKTKFGPSWRCPASLLDEPHRVRLLRGSFGHSRDVGGSRLDLVQARVAK
jgi:hypothetical protein